MSTSERQRVSAGLLMATPSYRSFSFTEVSA